MNIADDFVNDLLNLWFYKEPPIYTTPNDTAKQLAVDIIHGVQSGDDVMFSHPMINKIVIFFKDHGIIDYETTMMDLYYTGKIKANMKMREVINSPKVMNELNALINVLGDTMKKFENIAKEQNKKEKNRSAVHSLANKEIFRN